MPVLVFPAAQQAPAPKSVRAILAQYLDHLRARRSRKTLEVVRSAITRPILASLLDREPLSIRPAELELAHRNDPNPVAANRSLEILRAAWNRAERRGDLPKGSNPLANLSDYRATETPRAQTLPREATTAALAVLRLGLAFEPGTYARLSSAALLLTLLTGMRRGEVAQLTWANVLPGGRIALERGKTGGRLVTLPDADQALLDDLRPACAPSDAPVFPGVDLWRAWDRLRAVIGAPEVTLHDLRRTLAVRMLEAGGVDLSEVAKQLGHKSTRITSGVYSPLEVERSRRLSNLGAEALTKGPTE
jgi:integrase